MARLTASLRAIARTGRIEFESDGIDGSVLRCAIRVFADREEWPAVDADLREDDRFELLAFFEDLIGFGDIPHPASVGCGWPEFPLSFEGSYSGDGDEVLLRVIGDWRRRDDLREATLRVARSQLRDFWPQLAKVLHRT